MACVITLDGKEYNEAGFKQLLASGFLVNEINSGVLADSKSGIYKQYINGNGTQEATSGEAEQAATQGQEAQGAGTEAGQTTPGTEGANKIPGFNQLTTEQQQDLFDALSEIKQESGFDISPTLALNMLNSYLGRDNFPAIVNMKNAVLFCFNQSTIANNLRDLTKAGKTQIKGKVARTRIGQTLLNLRASMKSLGFDLAVLSDEDFDKFIIDSFGLDPTGRKGFYVNAAKTMVVKASQAQQVALHEFTHPLLDIIQSTNPAVYYSLVDEVVSLDEKEGNLHPDGLKFFDWAQKNYDGASQKTIENEALTELVSVFADRRISMNSTVAQAANRVWNKIMAFFKIQATIDLKVDDTLTIDKLAKAIAEAAVTSRMLRVVNASGINVVTREDIAFSKNRNLISDAGLSKYMTEDGDGNYVFYHRSNLDLTRKGIDPNKLGSNMRTGRDETMAKYPVSMYYTEPDIADVSGDYNHVVMIPKEKVYPADVDPLNLRPLAEKEFRKVFPNIAFDNNRAVSWIGKVAAEKGYDMIVASWSPRRNFKALRAESVIKHKPKLFVKPSSGFGYSVDVNEKYDFESNRKKKGVSFSKYKPSEVVTSNPVSFENAKAFANESSFNNKRQFKLALQDKLNNHIATLRKTYGNNFDPSKMDATTYKYMKDALMAEAISAIERHPEAIGWYEEKTQLALAVLSAVHPELKTDRAAKSAFIFILAVTSNGNKVDENFKLAEQQYEKFKKTGRFDPKDEFGAQQSGIRNSIKLFNSLLDFGLSLDQIADFFTSKHKVSDLSIRKPDGKKKSLASGELANEEVFGAMVLGAKIGNGFYMNMWGEFGQLTMDRWFMRTWLRLTGGLIKMDQSKIDEGFKRVGSELAKVQKSKSASEKLKGLIPKYSTLSTEELAKKINKVSANKDKRRVLENDDLLDELRKASNNYVTKLSGEVEAPNGGKQRKFIRDVFTDVKETLKKDHEVDITMADLQAVLWYPEKILYESFKKGQSFEESQEEYTEDSAPDYFNASKKIAKEKGVSNEKIEQIVSDYRRDTSSRNVGRGDQGAGESNISDGKESLETVRTALQKAELEKPKKTPKEKKTKGVSFSKQMTASPEVAEKFAESAKLFDQIQEAEGSAKKRRLAEERRNLIESSPEVKFIDDNIKNIYEQLENKGVLKREGNCP